MPNLCPEELAKASLTGTTVIDSNQVYFRYDVFSMLRRLPFPLVGTQLTRVDGISYVSGSGSVTTETDDVQWSTLALPKGRPTNPL